MRDIRELTSGLRESGVEWLVAARQAAIDVGEIPAEYRGLGGWQCCWD